MLNKKKIMRDKCQRNDEAQLEVGVLSWNFQLKEYKCLILNSHIIKNK